MMTRSSLLKIASLLLPFAVVATASAATNTFPTSGNVGIGTLTPAASLDVVGNIDGGAHVASVTAGPMRFTNNIDQQTFVIYGENHPLNALAIFGTDGYGFAVFSSSSSSSQYLLNLVRGASNPKIGSGGTSAFYVRNDGNVGIGTTAPAATLDIAGTGHVSGSLTVDGNIAAKYQDVAEWVEAPTMIEDGSVVVIDRARPNGVVVSTEAYDTRVAGVVSPHPGLILGEPAASKVKVATTGRVRVKVDATAAPIEIGDLLVTSDKPGVAMKSEPIQISGRKFHQPGTVIGKALEPLQHGTGSILVLLSMQ